MSGTFHTPLDELLIQDGEVFSYEPAATVSPLRRDYDPTNPPSLFSVYLAAERSFRVVLPRGYDEHPQRSYPVLYYYDGPWLWDTEIGGGLYDPRAENMASLVSSGAVGEMILVGVDHVLGPPCTLANARVEDCVSPEEDPLDIGCGVVSGKADRFALYLTQELKPLIDAAYRTLSDREHTFAGGYSLGGVLAMYLGWEHSDTYGAVASQSGSFWIPKFPERITRDPRVDNRFYIDTGTHESPIYFTAMPLRDHLAGRGRPYVEHADLRFVLGMGQDHSVQNGGSRQRDMATFLYPATSEPGGFRQP